MMLPPTATVLPEGTRRAASAMLMSLRFMVVVPLSRSSDDAVAGKSCDSVGIEPEPFGIDLLVVLSEQWWRTTDALSRL